MKDGGPAFPVVAPDPSITVASGMSLRDYFAAAALQGFLARPGAINGKMESQLHEIAAMAYSAADWMIKTREPKT